MCPYLSTALLTKRTCIVCLEKIDLSKRRFVRRDSILRTYLADLTRLLWDQSPPIHCILFEYTATVNNEAECLKFIFIGCLTALVCIRKHNLK